MVQELERKRQSAKFPETAPTANPVFFKTYSRDTSLVEASCKPHSYKKQNQFGGLRNDQTGSQSKSINKRNEKMANKANSKQSNTNSNDKPKADLPKVNLATRVKSTLGKTLKVTSPLVVMAGIVVSGVVGAVVAQRVLSVVESSNCGASVNFKSSPSSLLDFQLKKEACSKLPETAAK